MEKSIREVLRDFNNLDEFYGFYDWFCKTETLKRRAEDLLKKLKFLVDMGLIDPDKNYVWFKNNCPLYGSLYDDIRISEIYGNFLGGFCPKTGHKEVEEKCSFWTLDNGNLKTYKFKNWADFKKKLSTDYELREIIRNTFNKGNTNERIK